MKKYRTSEVAEMMGIHPNTVRFYEKWGLITKPVREENGYRIYTDADIRQLKIIRVLRCANYFLEAIRRMMQQLSENPEADTFYIGRFGFTHGNEKMIYDWRAPVSGIFYDYDIGRAGFEAPVGWIEGELTRKRQFKIRNGMMEYALESSTNVQDEVLQRELAHTSDEKMKSIISTIQREQNVIIRNQRANTLIIQGVAGSGKKSIEE